MSQYSVGLSSHNVMSFLYQNNLWNLDWREYFIPHFSCVNTRWQFTWHVCDQHPDWWTVTADRQFNRRCCWTLNGQRTLHAAPRVKTPAYQFWFFRKKNKKLVQRNTSAVIYVFLDICLLGSNTGNVEQIRQISKYRLFCCVETKKKNHFWPFLPAQAKHASVLQVHRAREAKKFSYS